LFAGGRPRDPLAMARMMSGAFDGIDKPVAAYIGTANGDNPVSFEATKLTLTQAGADKVVFIRLAKNKVNVPAAKKSLEAADVIFLSGGEVEDGMRWLDKHGISEFLRDLYKAGKRFIGVSAGTIMLGTRWTHWDVEGDDSTASLFDCLGVIPCLFDVHGEDEGWTELVTTLKLLGDGAEGYALPAGCVISADSGGIAANIEKAPIVFRNDNGRVSVYNERYQPPSSGSGSLIGADNREDG